MYHDKWAIADAVSEASTIEGIDVTPNKVDLHYTAVVDPKVGSE